MLEQYPDFNVKYPFSTFKTGKVNGYDTYLMTSSDYTEMLIEKFKEYADRGYDISSDNIQDRIFKDCGCDIEDLESSDVIRIKEEVERYCYYKHLI